MKPKKHGVALQIKPYKRGGPRCAATTVPQVCTRFEAFAELCYCEILLLEDKNLNFFSFYFQSAFYIEWSSPSIGTIHRDGSLSESKGDFAIKLQMLIEADSKTGYIATVKRAVDGEERLYIHVTI